MIADVSRDLAHWQGIARYMAGKYNRPFGIVKDTYGEYLLTPMPYSKSEVFWDTDTPEPIEQDIFETKSEPVVNKNAYLLNKKKALLAKLQAQIAEMEGG